MITISYLLSASYVFFILFCMISWLRIKNRKSSAAFLHKISVVVAVRNEENNITNLLNALNRQSLHRDLFEIIIVNDHSDDGTVNAVEEYRKRTFINISVFHLHDNERGKKAAIHKGVQNAKNEIVVTTDADCVMNENWLSVISSGFNLSSDRMMIMPVAFTNSNFRESCQALEFMSLQATTASFISAGYPVMCNGANLAFSRQAYLDVFGRMRGKEINSGDDTFLMFAVCEQFGDRSITYLKASEALVYTRPSGNLYSFIEQRVRWGKKTRFYNKALISFLGAYIAFINLFILVAFVAAFFSAGGFLPLLTFAGVKWVCDFIYLFSFSTFTKQEGLLQYFFYVQLLNPFYFLTIAFLSLVSAENKWKGRDTYAVAGKSPGPV